MEAVLILVIIAVLCLCLGVDAGVILVGVAGIAVLCIAAMFVLFSYSLVCLLFSRKTKAEFVKIDKTPKGRYNVAYYSVDGTDYPCIFPCESFLRKKIYSGEKIYKIRLSRVRKCVFDRFASATCIIGFVFSGLLTGTVGYCIYIISVVGTGGI